MPMFKVTTVGMPMFKITTAAMPMFKITTVVVPMFKITTGWCQCSRSLLLVVVMSLASLLSSKSLVWHTGGWLSEKESMD